MVAQHDNLSRWNPEREFLLVGQSDIIDHLTKIGITDHRGRRLTWTKIYRAARMYDFPLVKGRRRGRECFSALTSNYWVSAWLQSRKDTSALGPFRVFQNPRLQVR